MRLTAGIINISKIVLYLSVFIFLAITANSVFSQETAENSDGAVLPENDVDATAEQDTTEAETADETAIDENSEGNNISVTTLEQTVEDTEGEEVETSPWAMLAVGAKFGFTLTGMFADRGVVQLPVFQDGTYFVVSEYKSGFFPYYSYCAHVYATLKNAFQIQLEFWGAVYKGMYYDTAVKYFDGASYIGDPQAGTVHITMMYFQIPLLFRIEPDFYGRRGVKHLNLYFAFGPSFNILLKNEETSFQVDRGDTYDDDDRYVKPENILSDDLGTMDVGFIFAIGYTLKDIIPFINPVAEIRGEIGVVDLNDLSISGSSTESSARNWALYFTVGIDFPVLHGSIF